ncbi:MAG: hypothetical protein MZV64_42675 [Ignavibacteriales bacterium]|nr:hypothetical protein [Ignavibacteriales bacterium]
MRLDAPLSSETAQRRGPLHGDHRRRPVQRRDPADPSRLGGPRDRDERRESGTRGAHRQAHPVVRSRDREGPGLPAPRNRDPGAAERRLSSGRREDRDGGRGGRDPGRHPRWLARARWPGSSSAAAGWSPRRRARTSTLAAGTVLRVRLDSPVTIEVRRGVSLAPGAAGPSMSTTTKVMSSCRGGALGTPAAYLGEAVDSRTRRAAATGSRARRPRAGSLEELAPAVLHVGHAVGVEQEPVTGTERQRAHRVVALRDHADEQPAVAHDALRADPAATRAAEDAPQLNSAPPVAPAPATGARRRSSGCRVAPTGCGSSPPITAAGSSARDATECTATLIMDAMSAAATPCRATPRSATRIPTPRPATGMKSK